MDKTGKHYDCLWVDCEATQVGTLVRGVLKEAKEGVFGDRVPSGFTYLDEAIGGFTPGSIVAVIGVSGAEKDFLSRLALNIAKREEGAVFYISLDASKPVMGKRLLSVESGISPVKIEKQILGDGDHEKLVEAVKKLDELPLYIDDTIGKTSGGLALGLSDWVKGGEGRGIRAVIVDYLQLMQSPDSSESRGDGIREILDNLIEIAKEHDCVVFVNSIIFPHCRWRADAEMGEPIRSDLLTSEETEYLEEVAEKIIFVSKNDGGLDFQLVKPLGAVFYGWNN